MLPRLAFLLGAVAFVQASYGDDLLPRLIGLARSSVPEERSDAASSLSDSLEECGVAQVMPLYLELLNDPDPDVFRNTLQAIASTTPMFLRHGFARKASAKDISEGLELMRLVKPKVYELCKSRDPATRMAALAARTSIVSNLLNTELEMSPVLEHVTVWSISENPESRLDAASLLATFLEEVGVSYARPVYERLLNDRNENVVICALNQVTLIPTALIRSATGDKDSEDWVPFLRALQPRIEALSTDSRDAVQQEARTTLEVLPRILELHMP